MGGYLALVSASVANAAAVVAICPAGGENLRRGLADGRFTFDADRPALDRFLSAHDVHAAAAALEVPVLLLHAEGDEQVPVEQSRELAALLRSPQSRLIAFPGGHHRSIQHDAELQAVSIRFIERAFADPANPDDIRPAMEGHERTGYDEHERSTSQQGAGGADAGKISRAAPIASPYRPGARKVP